LRVLVLTSTFPRWANDNEPRFVLDLCRHLAAHADLLVLAPHTAGAALDEQIEGVRVRRYRYFPTRWQSLAYEGGIMARLRRNPARMLQVPFLLGALGRATRLALREWSPDVIHAHWIIPQGLVAAATAGGVPILCTSHGTDLHGLRGPLLRRLKAWTLKRCGFVTVVSDSLATVAHELAPGCPVDVIPMGTDVSDLFVPP
jgi:glycosyltransferase involved in cell wall biosynthesis